MRDPFVGLTALVVEDDWFVREDVAERISARRMGGVGGRYRGLGRSSGFGKPRRIDLLVTDIHLANAVTGWEVAEAARELHPMISVIYASGKPNNDSRRVPDSIFLSKPVASSGASIGLPRAPIQRAIAISAASIWTRREPAHIDRRP